MCRNDLYVLVTWPKSQELMEHKRFTECLLVEHIDEHTKVDSPAYVSFTYPQ